MADTESSAVGRVVPENTQQQEPFEPDWTLHPGGTIREAIRERRLTQRKVAAETGVSEKHLSQIVHGHANYSPAWAVRFAALLGVSPRFIWNLQSNYLIDIARGKKDVTRRG